MRKTITTIVIIVIIILAIAIGFGFYQWHCNEMGSLEKSQNELMAQQNELMTQRIQAIQNEAAEEKNSLLSQMNLLREQIDELLTEEVVVFDAAPIKEQFLEIGELATEAYYHTSVGSVDGVKHFDVLGWKVPGSSKTALIEMSGIVKVGIDVSKIEIVTDETTKTISITIPEAMILSNELFEETMVVHAEEEGIFTNITLADNSELRIELKSKAEQGARANGLFEKSRENAGKYVLALIEAIPSIKDTYTIVIK